ncbi:FecR domain-containing protein [Chitinophaga sedimenti]|uniref:FecR family protein n=1 Tax=Chitinophaga sedimenti TaxID=2033606 RepID=UPI0020067506|nr:FecR domain-containing protein [Chitinophaga sedimenti]MCK7554499.1 FecR domain-containing protein [Chitinophaga sedimenti]
MLATNTQTHLTLPGGRVVNLNDALPAQPFTIGSVTLNNDKEVLVLSAGKGTGAGKASLEVPAGKQHSVKLPDGTVARLNSASSLKFSVDFNEGVREVELTGEAYFDVARDEKRPFIVRSHAAQIKVLGTSFNVNSYNPKNIITSLRSGSIMMQGAGKDTVLKPGEAATVTASSMTVSKYSDDKAFTWKDGIIDFDKASLEEIGDALARWYDVKVAYARPGLKGGSYKLRIDKSKPIQKSLDVLKRLSDGKVNYTLEKGQLTFK